MLTESQSKDAISVFKNGWLVLDERYHRPDLANQFEVVFALVDEIKKLTDNKSMESWDVMFVAGSSDGRVYNILQVCSSDAVDVFVYYHKMQSHCLTSLHRVCTRAPSTQLIQAG